MGEVRRVAEKAEGGITLKELKGLCEDLVWLFERLKREFVVVQEVALAERKAREELVRLGQFEGLEAALERGRQAYDALRAPGD